ncbi:uncharacterized protein [Bemisia tabaci]|uniref:uncharacterized protein isoform X2 n=1 Tax=Bemisia tabaci TaxID=7038 RepID=UPI003B283F66
MISSGTSRIASTPNIHLSFLPVFYLSKLFGVMPFKFVRKRKLKKIDVKVTDASSSPRSSQYKNSVCDYMYSYCWLILTLAHGLSAPFYVLHTNLPQKYTDGLFKYKLDPILQNKTIKGNFDNETKQSISMKIINPLLVTLMSLGSRFISLYTINSNLTRFLLKLYRVDVSLCFMTDFRYYINHTKHLNTAVGLVFYFIIFGLPVNFQYMLNVAEINNELGITWCLILVLYNLASFCSDLQFIFFAYALRVRFEFISLNLEIFIPPNRIEMRNNHLFLAQPNKKPAKAGAYLRHPFLSKDIRKVDNLKKFLPDSPSDCFLDQYRLCDTIEIYRECHRQLCELLEFLNSMYQFHLLITLAACFLKVLFNIYFTMFGYVIGTASSHSSKEEAEYLRTILWSTYYVMRFLTLIISAYLTVDRATKTRIVVSTINNRFLDPDTKEEAIAAGTTYLVILVQFHSDKE